MAKIEQVEQWIGLPVLGAADEKLGKLTAIYLDTTDGSPTLGTIKPGHLGRSDVAVPLTEASFARGHVRIDYPKDLVHSAPKLQGSDTVTREDTQVIALHYGLELSGTEGRSDREPRLESTTSIRARAEAQADAEAEAARLEAAANEQGDRARRATDRVAKASDEAHEADAQRAELSAQAEAIRERIE